MSNREGRHDDRDRRDRYNSRDQRGGHQTGGHQPQPMMPPVQGGYNNPIPMVYLTKGMPSKVKCPTCNKDVTTEVFFEVGTHSWILAILLFPFCWLCWLPLVFDSLKDTKHVCPNCHNLIGIVGVF